MTTTFDHQDWAEAAEWLLLKPRQPVPLAEHAATEGRDCRDHGLIGIATVGQRTP